MDPMSIFGEIGDCDLAEIFQGYTTVETKKLKKRSSSANWGGVDELTAYEEKRYKVKMGYC